MVNKEEYCNCEFITNGNAIEKEDRIECPDCHRPIIKLEGDKK